jgi:predicted GH43/DUF377 family glycosyl hydrolase
MNWLFCLFAASLYALIDLEDLRDAFVLETKRIEIGEFPDAFNPSIARVDGTLLLSFRIRDPESKATNQIGFIWLDDAFQPVGSPKILEVRGVSPHYPEFQQDPRLITVGDKLYLVFTNAIEEIGPNLRRMHVAELHIEENAFYIERPECLYSFPGSSGKPEKNWVPFDFEGKLHLAYSIVPHLILRPILGTGVCEPLESTRSFLHWDWGVLRGGTPALPLDNEEYLAFFHSSILLATEHSAGKKIQHYFMGAYTFSRTPPFSLLRYSPKPIVGENFYRGPAHNTWKPLRVVFPGGYVADDRFIWIAYGRQDHEIWIAKLDKQGLLNSLVDCRRQ